MINLTIIMAEDLPLERLLTVCSTLTDHRVLGLVRQVEALKQEMEALKTMHVSVDYRGRLVITTAGHTSRYRLFRPVSQSSYHLTDIEVWVESFQKETGITSHHGLTIDHRSPPWVTITHDNPYGEDYDDCSWEMTVLGSDFVAAVCDYHRRVTAWHTSTGTPH